MSVLAKAKTAAARSSMFKFHLQQQQNWQLYMQLLSTHGMLTVLISMKRDASSSSLSLKVYWMVVDPYSQKEAPIYT